MSLRCEFALIERLVVIAIIAILAVLLHRSTPNIQNRPMDNFDRLR